MRITVETITREGNSINGNPRWRILTPEGRIYRTRRDTGDAYKITGNEAGREVEVELDSRGDIYAWNPS